MKSGARPNVCDEHPQLARDLALRAPFDRAAAISARANIAADRKECAVFSGLKSSLSGRNGAVSVRCSPIAARVTGVFSRLSAVASDAMQARRHHHDRGRVDATALDQIADGGIDRWRNAVVVGAQPDPTRQRVPAGGASIGSDGSVDTLDITRPNAPPPAIPPPIASADRWRARRLPCSSSCALPRNRPGAPSVRIESYRCTRP